MNLASGLRKYAKRDVGQGTLKLAFELNSERRLRGAR
jgi:hypothetical protein